MSKIFISNCFKIYIHITKQNQLSEKAKNCICYHSNIIFEMPYHFL